MQVILLRCAPNARFHFGQIAWDDQTSLDDSAILPHSDTLFSALVNTAQRYDDELADKLVEWFDTGRVRISSGCFCLEKADGGMVFFLPKPVFFDAWPADGFSTKDQRKIRFISKGVWEGGLEPTAWFDSTKCHILQHRFVLTVDEAEGLPSTLFAPGAGIYRIQALPKVTVHSRTKENGFFYQTSVLLPPLGGGLQTHYYFLLDHRLDAAAEQQLRFVIDLLADEGVGGERSVGCGMLEATSWDDYVGGRRPTGSEPAVTFSLVNPADGEDLKHLLAYRTVLRGGRNTLYHQQLQRVRLVAEGALCRPGLQGRAVELYTGKEKNVTYLRNGYAFSLPLSSKIADHVNLQR